LATTIFHTNKLNTPLYCSHRVLSDRGTNASLKCFISLMWCKLNKGSNLLLVFGRAPTMHIAKKNKTLTVILPFIVAVQKPLLVQLLDKLDY
jgi:hypothetical protein